MTVSILIEGLESNLGTRSVAKDTNLSLGVGSCESINK